ncbi:MAG: DUF4886 domain-containing protein [Eubacteriales bacterium]|nr:DUF4886 domain-containing protein [Eubacteriales bacterium]
MSNKKKGNMVWLLLAVCIFVMGGATVSADSGYDFFSAYNPKLAKPVKKNPKILMVGNSHTYYNKMPSMLKKICKSGGINAHIEAYAIGGHTLYQWACPAASAKKDTKESKKLFQALKTKKWDYVILQGATTEPVNSGAKMEKAIKKLMPMIKKSKAQAVFYQVWAPQKGYSGYFSDEKAVGQFQKKIVDKYNDLAKKYKAAVAPAGIAFRRAEKVLPGLNLYMDKKHASKEGSYLAACVLYSTMFKRKAQGTISLSQGAKNSNVLKELQQLAADVTIRAKITNNAQISMKKTEYVMHPGSKKKITYKVTKRAKNTRISSWKSNNKKVASVSSDGTVTACRAGTAQITAILNNGQKACCTITVK